MKIAIPTKIDFTVDAHFGHCEFFTVFEIDEEKNVVSFEQIDSGQECGCKSGIASTLQQLGVSLLLAGNIGGGAIQVLANNGIATLRGCEGNIHNVVKDYLQGGLVDSGLTCDHHDHH